MQNVLDFRATPAVDGLIVVAYGEQVPIAAGKIADNLVLHGVGVLKFVHQNIAETPRKLFARVFVRL